ncbi:MAG: hypothetical protein DDT39_01015 [Firmicutes bacterium]|nr:hypothetical protein [candidate division NPL-UPA2 bacterium]
MGEVDGVDPGQGCTQHCGYKPNREHAVRNAPFKHSGFGEFLVDMDGVKVACDAREQINVGFTDCLRHGSCVAYLDVSKLYILKH